ncbi:unnamed protein product [Cuscuta campestris]|uniref:Uncharacterized protein n=1 Tax=Cuscuta campestris TaxID=132261 RepID=A0A484NJ41_9ASTE|nr:unnamed protein product [Cuscuta campestris]
MAAFATISSDPKMHRVVCVSRQRPCAPRSSQFMTRRLYLENYNISQLSMWSGKGTFAPHSTKMKGLVKKGNCQRCFCFSSPLDVNVATASGWVSNMDQMLLVTSIFLTYIAEAVSPKKSFVNPVENMSHDYVFPKHDASLVGSINKKEEGTKLQFAWDVVESKLSDSLLAVNQGVESSISTNEIKQNCTRFPSSLSAIAEGPRLRLLWASFQFLKKEVDNLSEISLTESKDIVAPLIESIRKSSKQLCVTWLEKELSFGNSQADSNRICSMVDTLDEDGGILQIIRKLGKEDLYVELVSVTNFGFIRDGAYYDQSFFKEYGVAILEDLVITLAEGAASMYLELISVDSRVSNEMNSLGLSLCTLSTRALQRLRNEVAMHRWLHHNMGAVVSMYEDRFDLCTFESQPIEESGKRRDENHHWWNKLGLIRSKSVSSPLRVAFVNQISIAAKRTKELRSLSGWRYYFSLFLELSDIAMPLIRTVIAKVSDAISFFLVCLIGRSLGLIYTGIRQSLRWK